MASFVQVGTIGYYALLAGGSILGWWVAYRPERDRSGGPNELYVTVLRRRVHLRRWPTVLGIMLISCNLAGVSLSLTGKESAVPVWEQLLLIGVALPLVLTAGFYMQVTHLRGVTGAMRRVGQSEPDQVKAALSNLGWSLFGPWPLLAIAFYVGMGIVFLFIRLYAAGVVLLALGACLAIAWMRRRRRFDRCGERRTKVSS